MTIWDRIAALAEALPEEALAGLPPTAASDCGLRELDRAVDTYPQWPTDPVHAAAVVAEESGELVQAVLECIYQPSKSDIHHVRIEAVQTAAMALRFLARMDSYRFAPCEQAQDIALRDAYDRAGEIHDAAEAERQDAREAEAREWMPDPRGLRETLERLP